MKVKNIFAAVSGKSMLDPLLEVLDKKSVRFWGTEGTVKYLKSKDFWARSMVSGFDFDGRVKSLDRVIFARILADRTNRKHINKLKHLFNYFSSPSTKTQGKLSREVSSENIVDFKVSSRPIRKTQGRQARTISLDDWEPFDAVVVDLYKPDPKNFPESMDIGGQALIRAAIKNYKNVAVAFDPRSIEDLAWEVKTNKGMTSLKFRKKQAAKALTFIAQRCKLEASYFGKLS